MDETPRIVPVTDLRRHAASLIEEVNRWERPLFVSQRGYLTAVLLSCDRYERLQRGEGRRSRRSVSPSAWDAVEGAAPREGVRPRGLRDSQAARGRRLRDRALRPARGVARSRV